MIFFFATAICCAAAMGQNAVKWKANGQLDANGNGTVTLTATMADGWHIYGTEPADGGPVATSIKMTGEGFEFVGEPKASVAPKRVQDEMFGCELTYWGGKVSFVQKVRRVKKDAKQVTVKVTFMSCNDTNCQPPRTETLTVDF
ncbi:MAG: protein-disulfide reductase DsbD N-terminal domain-containing protein [Clostridium sp.]|nr:protein-disulfide reductase DsbD N-terminal domain-containing protein [Clostridium sp.]